MSISEFYIIGLVETWLSNDIGNRELFPENYAVVRCDRRYDLMCVSRGGGALLALKSDLTFDIIDMSPILNSIHNIDIVGCKCMLTNFSSIHIFVIYIPPNVAVNEFEYFLDLFSQIVCTLKNIVIMGDFNVPLYNSNSPDNRAQLMQGFCTFLDLPQCNNITNGTGRLLDLILSKLVCETFHDDVPLVREDTHHPALKFSLKLSAPKQIDFPPNATNVSYNFKKANFPALYASLTALNWEFLNDYTDINIACDIFYKILYSKFDEHVPVFKNKKRQFPSWYTFDVIKKIKRKERCRQKYRTTNNVIFLDEFKQLRSSIKIMIKEAYDNYIVSTEQAIITDPKMFWSFIKNKKDSTRIPGAMYLNNDTLKGPANIVNGFATFFRSVYLPATTELPNIYGFCNNYNNNNVITVEALTDVEIQASMRKLKNKNTSGHDNIPSYLVKDCSPILARPLQILFNLALKTNTFPQSWKLSRVCPVLKSGNSSEVANYRPISILCNFAKVFEKCLYSRIYPCVRNQISPCQHGFMENRSTVTNLMQITQFISEAINNRSQVDVVYTDLTKAFDRISHSILLHKLNNFGFHYSLLQFIKSYLQDRFQYVYYHGHKSNKYLATSGVPQGSNLGPLLFLLFIDDLAGVISCEKLLFADDLKIYCEIHSHEDCQALQEQINLIIEWCAANQLTLNASKCKIVSFTSKSNYILFNYSIAGSELTRSTSHKDLGVIFDYRLSFIDQINTISSSAMKSLGFVIRTCKMFHNIFALKVLYFSLVRSKLQYCSVIWSPIYVVHQITLGTVQRRFLKFLTFKTDGLYPERGISNKLLHDRFDIPTLQHERILHSLIFLYKLLNNKIDAPNLLALLPFRVPRDNMRASSTFYCPPARSNIMKKSPLYSMIANFNAISNRVDLNCCSFTSITRIAKEQYLPSDGY